MSAIVLLCLFGWGPCLVEVRLVWESSSGSDEVLGKKKKGWYEEKKKRNAFARSKPRTRDFTYKRLANAPPQHFFTFKFFLFLHYVATNFNNYALPYLKKSSFSARLSFLNNDNLGVSILLVRLDTISIRFISLAFRSSIGALTDMSCTRYHGTKMCCCVWVFLSLMTFFFFLAGDGKDGKARYCVSVWMEM